MDLGTALQLIVAVAMPFVLYILHGIRQSVHDLRNQLQPLASRQAAIDAELRIVKHRMRLADE